MSQLERNMKRARRLRHYWRFRSWLLRLFPQCDRECDWVYPFGFVPEDSCPVHDRPSRSRAPQRAGQERG